MPAIIRSVRPDEHQSVLEFWPTVFKGYTWEFYAQYYDSDPWQKDEYTRLCEVDGRVVAAVQLCRRPVESPWGELLMGGIANVATLVEHRGHGYSSQLLTSAIEIMEREGFDFSVLYTGINDFYARLGWVTVPCGLINATLDPERPVPPAPEGQEIPPSVGELREVYNAFNAGRPIAGVRPPEYWGWILGRLKGCRWVTVRESGRLIAYAASLTEQARVNIREICWLPGREDAVGPLAAGVAAQAAAAGVGEVFAIAPAEPALLQALQAAGVKAVPSTYKSAMFRRIKMDPARFEDLCRRMSSPQSIIWPADHF